MTDTLGLPVDVPSSESRGQRVLHPSRDVYVETVRTLRDDAAFVMCVDLTAADYLTNPNRRLPTGVEPERFELVVSLL